MTYEERLEEYILQHTTPESPLRKRLWREAHVRLLRARMLSGHLQMLCRLKGAKYVLELGTYTGYAAHCLAEALGEGGEVHTIESDDEMEDFIRSFIDEAPYKERIHLHLGDALTLLPSLLQRYSFDLVYIDANKLVDRGDYYELKNTSLYVDTQYYSRPSTNYTYSETVRLSNGGWIRYGDDLDVESTAYYNGSVYIRKDVSILSNRSVGNSYVQQNFSMGEWRNW